jgi:hypothetical protein
LILVIKLRITWNNQSVKYREVAKSADIRMTILPNLKVAFREGKLTNFNSRIAERKKLKNFFGKLVIIFWIISIFKLTLKTITAEPRGLEPLQTVLETVVLPLTPWLYTYNPQILFTRALFHFILFKEDMFFELGVKLIHFKFFLILDPVFGGGVETPGFLICQPDQDPITFFCHG